MDDKTLEDALTRLDRTLTSVRGLSATWRERYDLEDDETLCARVGAPDRDSLEVAAERLRVATGMPFPQELEAMLLRWNGIELRPAEAETDAGLVVVSSEALAEPVIWPASGPEDPLAQVELTLPQGRAAYVFGDLGDSGHLVLGLREGEARPPVFWVDREADLVPPRRVAGDLAAFLGVWCDVSLILPGLLEVAGVVGWQLSKR